MEEVRKFVLDKDGVEYGPGTLALLVDGSSKPYGVYDSSGIFIGHIYQQVHDTVRITLGKKVMEAKRTTHKPGNKIIVDMEGVFLRVEDKDGNVVPNAEVVRGMPVCVERTPSQHAPKAEKPFAIKAKKKNL